MIPRAEHPRPDWEREHWLNLNGAWDFAFSDAVICPELDRTITVPYSWAAPLSGVGEDVKGTGWYRRTARFDAQGRVFLVIGAADYETQVFVNGKLAGQHRGGYGEIRLDVTPYWVSGADNDIAVRVTDLDADCQPRGKQGYGEIRGIWQTVYLEEAPATHLKRIKTETKCDGAVTIRAWIHAAESCEQTLRAAFDGKEFAQSVQLAAGENEAVLTFTLENPKLWSCDNPYLYEGTVALGQDVVHTYFGVREIGYRCFDGREFPWVTLNGEPIYLNGTLDQSFNPQGYFTLPTEDDVRQEVQRIKDIGLNLMRLHIKPEEPRKLYWMDKLGVLAWADMVCFWGEPLPDTRAQYERELEEFVQRDWNHPCVMAWIVFNETWGLFSPTGDHLRQYTTDTQHWVRRMYEKVKAMDATRLVEDNSACNYDHVVSDMNTWHFYLNGYMTVKEHIDTAAKNAFEGSGWNYIGGNKNRRIPLINSECGMVWGVQDNAGDSDLAWQYHYMLNEYRLHENICGFVFTEFHDVVNEFNGYYRIDNQKKHFGYDLLGMGMELTDLHAKDFIAYDAPPCRTVGGGEQVETHVYCSSFSGAPKGQTLTLEWFLHGEHGYYDGGSLQFEAPGSGLKDLGVITVTAPKVNDVAALTFRLVQGDRVLSRNFCTLDVRGARQGAAWVRPRDYVEKHFDRDWLALSGHKLCGTGAGSVAYEIPMENLMQCDKIELRFEAGAKRLLAKDADGQVTAAVDANFMHGYKMDPGTNHNSYFMTDEETDPSRLTIKVEGAVVDEITLPDDPADCNGVLSWHYQARERYLDEAGSYGYLMIVPVEGEILRAAQQRGSLRLELSCDQGGLALYGRNAGRFALDIEAIAK